VGRDWRDDRIAELEAQVAALIARVEELEAKLRESSQNSSKPPSADPPGMRKPKRKRSGRKPGGQTGHEGHQRALLPPEQVDEFHDVWPDECENCHQDLGVGPRVEACEPGRHQVTELPVPKAQVAEWRTHAQCCPACSWVTQAKLPEAVPQTCFGPRLQATVAVLTGTYRLSKRMAQGLLNDLFGVEMALGSVTACEQRTSEALAEPVEEARRYAQCQPVGYADETGWRQGGKRAWVWVLVTTWVTVFLIHARRSTDAAKELLGNFAGILVSDRWSAYGHWALDRRQLCWAHLIRYWTAFSERRGEAGRIGRRLLALSKQMFKWWYRVRDGTMARSTFQRNMRPVREEVERLLEEGTRCGVKKVAATCNAILDLAPAMWTFIRVEGVEPTNNFAEQAVRDCVIRRKVSFGTHSADGGRFLERMLTVSATLKQQKRNVLDFVAEVCDRANEGLTPSSLLPGYRAVTLAQAA
jgi:transposase